MKLLGSDMILHGSDMMKKLLVAVCLSLLISVLSSCVMEDEPEAWSIAVGERCPEFSVVDNFGETVTTEDLRGYTTILVFFNTSCGDCRRELPELQRYYETQIRDNPDKKILCISRGEDAESISKYWEANELTLPYAAQEDRAVYSLFAESGIPRLYQITPNLIITAEANSIKKLEK